MKRYILFLLLLLFPFIAKAEVKITNIEELEKTAGLEIAEPTFEGLKINFDFKFSKVGDYVKYKITIKNENNKDYEVDMGEAFSDGEYIKYEFSFVDAEENNILKANTEKDIIVEASYNKMIPFDKFENGKFVETNKMAINLSHEEPEQENPKTAVGMTILIVAIIMFIALLILLINKYKLDQLYGLLLVALLSVPFVVIALEKISIELETKIEIELIQEQFEIHSCSYEHSFDFAYGMTWEDYMNSSYFAELSEDDKNTIAESVNNSGNGVTFSYASIAINECMEAANSYEDEEACEAQYPYADVVNKTDEINDNTVGSYFTNLHCK